MIIRWVLIVSLFLLPCCGGSGDAPVGDNEFTINEFTLPGDVMNPVYLTASTVDQGVITLSVFETQVPYTIPEIVLQFNVEYITGPGSYSDISYDILLGEAVLLYMDKDGRLFIPIDDGSGVLNISKWSMNLFDTIEGDFTVNMQNASNAAPAGILSASFSAVLGSSGLL